MKHALKDMTFAEFRERLPEGPVILLPLGSQEEQGPHAPMGDYMLAREIADRVAKKAGAIAAPTLPFGHADFFRCVPGGMQLRSTTFIALVEDMVESFLDHRIDRVVILNGHSSNAPLIDQALRQVRRRQGVAVASIDLWRAIPDSLWRSLFGDDFAAVKGHGAEPLTSVYRYLFPDLLRPDLLRPSVRGKALGLPMTGPAGVNFQGQGIYLPLNATEVNADGMLGGDPTRGSAEIGKAIVDHLVDFCADFAKHLAQSDPRNLFESDKGGKP